MKIHTVLLVACLMTVPAVAAEGPATCTETEDGLSCEGAVALPDDGGVTAAENCKPLEYSILVKVLPEPHLGVRPECITHL